MKNIKFFFIGIFLPIYVNFAVENISYLYENNFYSQEGTYNTLKFQTAFCKMQGYDTTKRENSFGPSLFTSGKIQFGVGLSSLYFGDIPNEEGLLTCGMCLNITNIKRMPTFSNDLTTFEPKTQITTPFLAMVFDQCKDPICQQDGFLDFDIYSNIPSNNIEHIEWNAIECPIDENDTIELLFCSENTCNVQNIYQNTTIFGDLISPYFMSIIPRNMRIPIQKIQVMRNNNWKDLKYISAIGWTWTFPFDKTKDIQLRIISYLGDIIELKIPINTIVNKPISLPYRGGIIYDTQLNFYKN